MFTVVENKNESVDITDKNGNIKTFLPNFDLDKSKELLTKFNNIKTKDGRYIYELWSHDGYYLFPALQEWLYWHYFVQIVKHNEAAKYIDNNYRFNPHNYYVVGGLRRIHNILNYNKQYSFFLKAVFNILTSIARSLSSVNSTIFGDDGDEGFRYQKLKNILEKNIGFSRVRHINKKFFFGDGKSLFTGYKKLTYLSNDFEFNYNEFSFLHEYMSEDQFYQLINSIDCRVQNIQQETKILESYLTNKNVDRIILYDQIEVELALVLASKKLKIATLGYQHGVIMKHHAGWLGFGIPKAYCNLVPDSIIVWGKYWKDKLIKYSNKYDEKNIIIGVNPKAKYSFKSKYNRTKNKQINILFPYEFLADNIKLSNYIRRLINNNFNVYIKLRPKGNGDIENDIFAFDEDIREKIIFSYEILEQDIINTIDVIGCTHSTYAYEMMQYSKPIWYFKTGLSFLEDIVEDNIAHLIDDRVMDQLSNRAFIDNYLEPSYDSGRIKDVFNDVNFDGFIADKVLS